MMRKSRLIIILSLSLVLLRLGGFTAALVSGKDLKEALRWGTANAAFVTQKVGAQAGLLKKAELQKALKKWKS